jgi:hypothetical protein
MTIFKDQCNFLVNRVIGNHIIRSTNSIIKLPMSRKYITSPYTIHIHITGHTYNNNINNNNNNNNNNFVINSQWIFVNHLFQVLYIDTHLKYSSVVAIRPDGS